MSEVKPFYHLQSDGFWQLVAREGCEMWVGGLKAAPSLMALRRHVVGARLDGELVQVLRATEGFMRVKQAVAEWLRSGYRTTGFREPGDDAFGSNASTGGMNYSEGCEVPMVQNSGGAASADMLQCARSPGLISVGRRI